MREVSMHPVIFVVVIPLVLTLFTGLLAHSQDFVWRKKLVAPANAIGLNPLNTNSIYAQDSVGTLSVSYDRGNTWTRLGTPGVTARQILVHPEDTTVIFCGGYYFSSPSLMRSSDHGATWQVVIPDFGMNGNSLVFDSMNPDLMYAGNREDGGVYRSSNRGETWTLQGDAGEPVCSMVNRPDSTNILSAGTGGGSLARSVDSGVSWETVAKGVAAEIPSLIISPLNPTELYAAALGTGILKSFDGGRTRSLSGLDGMDLWSLAADSTGMVYAGTFDSPARIFRSSDQGVSWQEISSGLSESSGALDMKVHPRDPNAVWCAAGNVYRWVQSRGSIEGLVLDAVTGDTVRTGTIERLETEEVIDLDSSNGSFMFTYFDGDPSLEITARVESFPYLIHNEPLTFILDSATTHNIELDLIPYTSITGSVRSITNQAPLSALVTLTSVTPLGSQTNADSTDVNGIYLLDSLLITYPPFVSYDTVLVSPEFPFATLVQVPPLLDTNVAIVDLLLDTADVLVTRTLSSGPYSGFYLTSLMEIGVSSHYWNPNEQGTPPLERTSELREQSLIYFSGDDTTELQMDELTGLSSCLNSGAHAFITGQNFVEKNQNTLLVNDILGLAFDGTSSSPICRGVNGDLFDSLQISTFLGSGANNQDSRDRLTPLSAHVLPSLTYGLTGADGISAVRIDSVAGGGKVILFGFGFEAISLASIRAEVLETILGYFDGSVVVDVRNEHGLQLPKSVALDQNYPNPFNPITEISYDIPKSFEVNLRVFNILGQEIATLVNRQQEAGSHTVRWDATAEPSGIYFYRLKAGDFLETKKMVVVK